MSEVTESMSVQEKLKAQGILGYEFRHAVYCAPPQGYEKDLHVVKEIIHYTDGTQKPNILLLADLKRPYYITKKGFQNHKQKKEWESVDRLIRGECTQTNLIRSAARALGQPGFNGQYRMLARSPYLYGTDISAAAILKQKYRKQFPELMTKSTVAVFDTETDVLNGTNQIITASITMGSRVYACAQRSFLSGHVNAEEKVEAAFKKYLSAINMRDPDTGDDVVVDLITRRGLQLEFEIVESELDVVKRCFEKAHEWMPDILTMWNIDFDIPTVVRAIERAGANPADIFSDPKVPKAYRHFRYKQGTRQKRMASGRIVPLEPSEQWHTVYAPASFYILDAMCVYRLLRTQKGKLPSYKLDFILDKEIGARKLRFDEAEGFQDIDWHLFMQERFKIEYIIYNIFDCISVELLDERTTDLSLSVPMACECSDLESFKSQPRRIADRMHFALLERGYVIGSTSDQMRDEIDDKTLGLEDWITALPAHLITHSGMKVIEEYPDLVTNIRTGVAD